MNLLLPSPRLSNLAFAPFVPILIMLLVSAVGAQAQPTVLFAAGQSTVASVGLSEPAGVAVDAAGNLFIADTGNNRIEKLTPAGVQSTAITGTVLGKALKAPNSVSFDGKGNLYIADAGNNRVLKMTSTGSFYAVGIGLLTPSGVVGDTYGNVYIADTGNDRIVAVAANGAQATIISNTYFQTGPQLSKPVGIGLGPSFGYQAYGYLYVVDTGNSRIISGQLQSGTFSLNEIFGTGLKQPKGIAPLNQNTGIYVTDSGNNRLVNAAYSNQYTVGGGFSDPGGTAMDGAGNIFIADTGNNRIVEMQTAAVDLGAISIGSSKTETLTFGFTATNTLSAKVPVLVSTQGAAGLDFQNAGGGSCAAKTYATGSSCTVKVIFKPTLAGERAGGVVLQDVNGVPLATAYLRGSGVGPQIAYDPGVQTNLATGLSSPEGITVDGAGNVYVADYGNGQIAKVTPAGIKSTFANIQDPVSLTIDGAGNLYAIGSNAISGGGSGLNTFLVTPGGKVSNGLAISGCMYSPVSVAVDSAANMYEAGTNSTWAKTTLTTTYNYGDCLGYLEAYETRSVAADTLGNIFVVDSTDWLVWKLTPAGGWSTVGSGYDRPESVAVDSFNNVYVADFGNDRVVKVTPSGVQSTVGTGLIEPTAVTVDGAGNIYIAELDPGTVVKINRSTPPTLSFATTVVGKTSSDSPKDVTVENIGNAELQIGAGLLPAAISAFRLGNGTTCPIIPYPAPALGGTLASGATCVYQVSFEPFAAGTIKGQLLVTDDNLNVAGTTQSISLLGIATAAPVAVKWPVPAAVPAGTALSSKQLDATAAVPGKFVYNPAAGTKVAKGTVKLTTTFTPTDTSKYKTTTATVDLVVQ